MKTMAQNLCLLYELRRWRAEHWIPHEHFPIICIDEECKQEDSHFGPLDPWSDIFMDGSDGIPVLCEFKVSIYYCNPKFYMQDNTLHSWTRSSKNWNVLILIPLSVMSLMNSVGLCISFAFCTEITAYVCLNSVMISALVVDSIECARVSGSSLV